MRRATVLERLCAALQNDGPKPLRRLQKASRNPEALIDTQSPVLIGLISMLIDSEDRGEISKALRWLWQRGSEILNRQLSKRRPKELARRPIEKPAVEAPARW